MTLTATDGTETGRLSVSVAINRPPVWSVSAPATVAADGTVQVDFAENGTGDIATLTLTDADNDNLGVTEKSTQGSDNDKLLTIHVDVNTNGQVRLQFQDTPPDYESPTDFNADNVYEMTLRAWNNGVVGASFVDLPVSVTVTNVNEAPEAVADTDDTDEDTPVDISVLDNDSDVDAGTTLSVSAVGTPAKGSAAITTGSTTTVTYTPDENIHGTDIFSYTISDGADPPGTATATVTVNDEEVDSASASSAIDLVEAGAVVIPVGVTAEDTTTTKTYTVTVLRPQTGGALAVFPVAVRRGGPVPVSQQTLGSHRVTGLSGQHRGTDVSG